MQAQREHAKSTQKGPTLLVESSPGASCSEVTICGIKL